MNNLMMIILFVLGLFVLAQVYVRLSMLRKKGKKIEPFNNPLWKSIEQGGKHLLYFYTSSCSACIPMTPRIEMLQKEFPNIHKINLGTDMEIGRHFGVMGTPSVIFVENGTIRDYLVGSRSEAALKKLML